MSKPTQKQIEAQVAALLEIKPRVRRNSAFGDDHHDAIDAQVHVLKRRMSLNAIYDFYEDAEDNVRDEAVNARAWLDGELDDADDLVSMWEELVID